MNIETVITEELRKHIDDNMSNDDIWIIVAEFQRAVKTANYAKRSNSRTAGMVRGMYREVSWSNVYEALTGSEATITKEALPVIHYNSSLEEVQRVLNAGHVIGVQNAAFSTEYIWKAGGVYYRRWKVRGIIEPVVADYSDLTNAWRATRVGNEDSTFFLTTVSVFGETDEPLPAINYDSPLDDVECVLDAGKVIQVCSYGSETAYEKLWKDGATYVRQYVGSAVPSEYTKPDIAWWHTKLGHSGSLFKVIDRE